MCTVWCSVYSCYTMSHSSHGNYNIFVPIVCLCECGRWRSTYSHARQIIVYHDFIVFILSAAFHNLFDIIPLEFVCKSSTAAAVVVAAALQAKYIAKKTKEITQEKARLKNRKEEKVRQTHENVRKYDMHRPEITIIAKYIYNNIKMQFSS